MEVLQVPTPDSSAGEPCCTERILVFRKRKVGSSEKGQLVQGVGRKDLASEGSVP